jgi:acyl-CoA thioesterase
MSTFNSVEEAREYFRHDRFALVNGVHLDELGEDWSRASLDLTADHKNANNGVMGGAIFTLADLAFAAAANNVHRPTWLSR